MSSAEPASLPVPSPSARIGKEFRWLTMAGLAGLGAIALVLCAVQYHRERIATLEMLEASTIERAAMLDAALAAVSSPVTALRRAAESAGKAPTPHELAGLARLLPALADLGFHTDDTAPAGEPRWSPVYPDPNGETLRATYTEPAFANGRRLGAASAGIALGFLHRAVEMPDYSDQRLVLTDRTRHVLADSRVGPAQGKSAALALGEVLPSSLIPDEAFTATTADGPREFASQGYTVLAVPLSAAPWVLVCLVPEGALFLRVMPWLSMTLALLVTVFVVLTGAHFYMSRRFIQPALTLVRLVGAETSGDVLPPQRVPPLWQPLVGRVASAFSTGRVQLARALGEAEHLGRRVDQHAEELTRLGAALDAEGAERRTLDLILADAPAVLMVLDGEGRILRFNKQCEALSGVNVKQATGRLPWTFLVPRDEADLLRVQVATALRGDGPIRGEIHWLNPNGPPHRLLWSLTMVSNGEGEPVFVVALGLKLQEPA